MSWKFEWFEGGTANTPVDLLNFWRVAAEDHGNIWQFPEIAASWEQTIAKATGRTPHLMVGRNNRGQTILYPLYIHYQTILRTSSIVIEPLGADWQFDYQDPLEAGPPLDADQRRLFWRELRPALRKRFGFNYDFTAYRLSATSLGNESHRIPNSAAPFINLEGLGSLQQFLAQRGTSHRERVNRGLRQLDHLGCNSLRLVAPQRLKEHLSQFCMLYEQQWGRGGRSHVLQDPAVRTCWTLLAENAAKLNKLHFSALFIADEPLSYVLGFEHRGTLLWYKPTYSLDFEKHSPGTLHMAFIIQHCIERGLKRLDLGWGTEPHKARWTDQQLALHSLRVQSGVCALDSHLRSAAGRLRDLHPNLYGHAKRLVVG